MKKENTICFFVALLVISLLTVGFVPAPQATAQSQESIISINMEALKADIEKAVMEKVDKLITEMSAKIATLEGEVKTMRDQVNTLEKLAHLPTVTPLPKGTQAPTPTITPTPNPSGYDCKTELLSPYYFGQFSRDAEFAFRVKITNTGSKTWDKDVVIAYKDGLKAEVEDLYAYAMPVKTLAPNESFEFSLAMRTPKEKKDDGKYTAAYVLSNGTEDFCEFGYSIYVP